MSLDTTYLDELIARDGLLRGEWIGTDAHGRETACLLAALSPDVRHSHSPRSCPASIMPAWLAYLTPWIDDTGSTERWPAMIARYATLARRWHVLDAGGWRRAEYRARRAALVEAMTHTNNNRALAACRTVTALCARVISGDEPDRTEWAEAAEAAEAAAAAAEAAAEAAAWAAAWAAADAAAWAAAEAAEAAAEAAARAAWAAWAAAAARAAAAEAAGDRMIDAILDGLEIEISAAEAA